MEWDLGVFAFVVILLPILGALLRGWVPKMQTPDGMPLLTTIVLLTTVAVVAGVIVAHAVKREQKLVTLESLPDRSKWEVVPEKEEGRLTTLKSLTTGETLKYFFHEGTLPEKFIVVRKGIPYWDRKNYAIPIPEKPPTEGKATT